MRESISQSTLDFIQLSAHNMEVVGILDLYIIEAILIFYKKKKMIFWVKILTFRFRYSQTLSFKC